MTTVSPAPAPGDVAVMRLPIGGYGACQVTGADRGMLLVHALAWESADRPELRQLAGAPPLILDHHAHRGEPALVGIGDGRPIPPGWAWLGRLPVPPELPDRSDRSAGWWWIPAEIAAQRRWDRRLPGAVKQAYRAAATRGPIEVDLGAGPVTLGAATARLDLTGAGAGPVRWSALDDLARCTSIVWAGPDRGLVAALAAHPIVQDLTWTDAPAEVDLRGTGLTSLAIGGGIAGGIGGAGGLLRLPDGLTSLHLTDGARARTVAAAGDGEWLTLTVTGPAPLPGGLGGLRELRYAGRGTISAAPMAGLPELESLWLAWSAAPGDLGDAAALGELPRLAQLTLTDAYGIDAGTLPDLPALTGLTIHGLRRTAAAAIKARYRRTAVRVTITGAKNDTWLAANLTNPLRDWADDDPRAGAAACKAYATAVRAVDTGPADADSAGAAAILRAFVDELNRVDQRYGLIDTLRRDQAGDAFVDLAGRAGVPPGRAEEWFEEWRAF